MRKLEQLAFTLNRVIPYFLLILLGLFLQKKKVFPQTFFAQISKLVFQIIMPVNVFVSVCAIDLAEDVDLRMLLYASGLMVATFFLIWLLCEIFVKNKAYIGTMVQGMFRSNYLILGAPLMLSVLGGDVRATSMLLIALIVPGYNILALVVLLARGASGDGRRVGARLLLKSIATNHIVIATVLAILWNMLPWPLPPFAESTLQYLSQTLTGLALLSVGGIFDWVLAKERIWPALAASAVKIVLLPVFVVAVSYILGFRGRDLCVLFFAFASPAAVSSYSMAAEVGGDAPLAANILIITTVCSILTLSLGIWVMRMLGWA